MSEARGGKGGRIELESGLGGKRNLRGKQDST